MLQKTIAYFAHRECIATKVLAQLVPVIVMKVISVHLEHQKAPQRSLSMIYLVDMAHAKSGTIVLMESCTNVLEEPIRTLSYEVRVTEYFAGVASQLFTCFGVLKFKLASQNVDFEI